MPENSWKIGGAFGGTPMLVAVFNLREPVRDAWGGLIGFDSVAVSSAVVGITDMAEGEVLVGDADDLGARYLAEHPEGVRFCVGSADDHKAAEEIIERHIIPDVNDFRGSCWVQACYPAGLRDDTENQAWNSMARELSERATKDHERVVNEIKAARKADRDAAVEKLTALGLSAVPIGDCALEVEGVRYEADYWGHTLGRLLKDAARVAHRLSFWKAEAEKLRHGEVPVFKIGGHEYYYNGRRVWHVDVPRAAMGQLIGRGGKNIRAMEEMLGARVKLHPHDNIPSGHVVLNAYPRPRLD